MGVKFFTVMALSILISSFAKADSMGSDGDKFYEEAARFTNACSEQPCKGPYTSAILYNQKTAANKLNAVLKVQLKKVAWEQAQIWGDTILEGDYTSSGNVRLDLVTAFYKNSELVGYTIQYSEKAWYTGECNYDGSRKTLSGCQEGRIIEASYVSPDLETFFTDEDKYADFASGDLL